MEILASPDTYQYKIFVYNKDFEPMINAIFDIGILSKFAQRIVRESFA